MKKILFISLLAISKLFAHGGHDDAPGTTSSQVVDPRLSFVSESDNFELLVKYFPTDSEKETTVWFYLSDYKTNAPLPGAILSVSFPDDSSLKATVTADSLSGRYQTTLTFPQRKTYTMVVSVSANSVEDILPINDFLVGPDTSKAHAQDLVHEESSLTISGILFGAVLGILLVLVLILLLRWRKVVVVRFGHSKQ